MAIVPGKRPQATHESIEALVKGFNLTGYPVRLVGVRGYYAKTMGATPGNDIGIYDDAIFILTPDTFVAFNANTDPSRALPGVAVLKPGGPYLYRLGMHNMAHPYLALRQYGNVTVLREGKEFTDSPEARFYIDIHRGGFGTTSSLGCQTIHPTQWEDFLDIVKQETKEYNQSTIPYVLINNS